MEEINMTKTDEAILYSDESKMPVKLIYGGCPIINKKKIAGRCSGLIHRVFKNFIVLSAFCTKFKKII